MKILHAKATDSNYCILMQILCSSVRVDWLDRGRNHHRRPLHRSISHTLSKNESIKSLIIAWHFISVHSAHTEQWALIILRMAMGGVTHIPITSEELTKLRKNHKTSNHHCCSQIWVCVIAGKYIWKSQRIFLLMFAQRKINNLVDRCIRCRLPFTSHYFAA